MSGTLQLEGIAIGDVVGNGDVEPVAPGPIGKVQVAAWIEVEMAGLAERRPVMPQSTRGFTTRGEFVAATFVEASGWNTLGAWDDGGGT